MFSKSGFKILGLSCMLFIILLLGKAPVVCAFPSGDLPPIPCPGGTTRITGPAFVGLMTVSLIEGDSEFKATIFLSGRCKTEVLTNVDMGISRAYNSAVNFATTTGNDFEGTRFGPDLANLVACSPQGATPIINTTTTFSNDGQTMLVGIVILWEVCVQR